MPTKTHWIVPTCGHEYERTLTGTDEQREVYAHWWFKYKCPDCRVREMGIVQSDEL